MDFEQLIDKPTPITANYKILLDHIYCIHPKFISDIENANLIIMQQYVSGKDHAPNFLHILYSQETIDFLMMNSFARPPKETQLN